tara:strand:- start:11127 stop:13079 length:1953 start_codon:yes stop_codon:yes gene_type:complete
MASTYTDGLAVEIIGSGDKAGSWGDVTNNNLKALEEGISRYAEISAAGSNTSTLNIPDGQTAYTDDSKGRSAVIKWTGAIASGDSHTVTLQVGGAEATQARFTAINGLSSSKDLVIDTASGTSLTIPNGYSANIHIDGSGNVINSLSGLAVEKIALKNNEIISNETNDEIIIAADTVKVGDDGAATLSSNGNQDLILKTGNTTTGSITLVDGTDGDISITPHNNGKVVMDKVNIGGGEIDGTPIGANSANTGAFSTLSATGTSTLVAINASGNIATSGSTTITAANGLVATAGGLTVNAGGIDVNGGSVDLASGGITNTGSIAGATTITATGEVTAGSVDTQDLHNAGALGISTTTGEKITLTANSSSIDLISASSGGVNTLSGENTKVVLNTGSTNSAGNLLVGQGTGTATVKPGGTGRLELTSSSIATSSGQEAIHINASAGRIGLEVGENSDLITFRIPISSAPTTPVFQGFFNENGLALHGAGGQYLNFSSGTGSTGFGLRGNSTYGPIEFRAANGGGIADTWGRIYHSGMASGDGAYFEVTQTDVSASSVTTHSTSFSSVPSIVTCYLKCTSDEQGYTSGDHVLVSSTSVLDTGSTGLSVTFDGTASNDITVTVGDGGLYVLHKADGNEVALDESKWDLVIKAWK